MSTGINVREVDEKDFDAIVSLNLESEHFLSPMNHDRLIRLHRLSAYHRAVEEENGVVAFLLAFREGTDYDSPNYRWFVQRFQQFLYVDRIVVSADQQGRGHASVLYDDLFDFARGKGVSHVTCEYDINPPNPRSRRFHEKFGFVEVGRQSAGSAGKHVSLQSAWVSA